jgi:hypothetical protein
LRRIHFIIACSLPLLIALIFLSGCSSFQSRYDDKFVYGPLMQFAADPSQGTMDFASLDFDTESMTSTDGGGGSGGGGAPPCPT